MKIADLRKAAFDALNVAEITGLLSHAYAPLPPVFYGRAPQSADSGDASKFPYVTFSFPSRLAFNTKDETGTNAILQVDVWSRDQSTQCETVADVIGAALDRKPLSASGHITTEWEGADVSDDPDGVTRHAVLRFRILALG